MSILAPLLVHCYSCCAGMEIISKKPSVNPGPILMPAWLMVKSLMGNQGSDTDPPVTSAEQCFLFLETRSESGLTRPLHPHATWMKKKGTSGRVWPGARRVVQPGTLLLCCSARRRFRFDGGGFPVFPATTECEMNCFLFGVRARGAKLLHCKFMDTCPYYRRLALEPLESLTGRHLSLQPQSHHRTDVVLRVLTWSGGEILFGRELRSTLFTSSSILLLHPVPARAWGMGGFYKHTSRFMYPQTFFTSL